VRVSTARADGSLSYSFQPSGLTYWPVGQSSARQVAAARPARRGGDSDEVEAADAQSDELGLDLDAEAVDRGARGVGARHKQSPRRTKPVQGIRFVINNVDTLNFNVLHKVPVLSLTFRKVLSLTMTHSDILKLYSYTLTVNHVPVFDRQRRSCAFRPVVVVPFFFVVVAVAAAADVCRPRLLLIL
jgi:hypothetical protein